MEEEISGLKEDLGVAGADQTNRSPSESNQKQKNPTFSAEMINQNILYDDVEDQKNSGSGNSDTNQ